jgi:hypothetical protein
MYAQHAGSAGTARLYLSDAFERASRCLDGHRSLTTKKSPKSAIIQDISIIVVR